MQKFDFTAPASGASQPINATGRYLKYVTGNAGGNDTGLIVTPEGKPGSTVLLYPGQAIRQPLDQPAPTAWTVRNALGQAQISGSLVIGNGQIDDNTLSGTVQVVDGGKARTLANMAYGAGGNPNGVAGQYSQLQLWNPSNSGKRLVVESMLVWAQNGGCTFYFESSTAALATLVANGQPKLLSGNAGIGAVYTGSTATAPPAGSAIGTMPVSTGTTYSVVPHEPYVIPPGYGLVIINNLANNSIAGSFEWYEEPNV